MSAAIEKIVDYEFNAAAPVLASWFGETTLREAVECECTKNARGAASIDPGAAMAPQEPGRRFLLEFDGGACIAVYQDQADNVALPHLVVLHRSFEIASAKDAAGLRAAVRSVDPGDTVRQVCFFHRGDQPLGDPAFKLRSHYLAGLMGDIAGTPMSLEWASLRAVEPDSLDFYDEYFDWYREFWRQRPELQPHVRVEPLEDVREFLKRGGVRLLMFENELCGMMAALREVEQGLIGWRIREKVIGPRFWGRGFSAAANVLMAQSLPAEPHCAMWGTIAPANAASLRSAEKVGRRIVGSTYWLTI